MRDQIEKGRLVGEVLAHIADGDVDAAHRRNDTVSDPVERTYLYTRGTRRHIASGTDGQMSLCKMFCDTDEQMANSYRWSGDRGQRAIRRQRNLPVCAKCESVEARRG